jgi:holo-[acyl-carrier protein] synthase
MVKGIGVDLVEIDRFGNAKNKEEFLNQILTEREMQDIPDGEMRDLLYATVFAIKEAVLKALGCGLTLGSCWHDIEISKNFRVALSGAVREAARAKSVTEILVSESHSEDYAVALVIIE